MDSVWAAFSEQGWALANMQPEAGSRRPNPTHVDVIVGHRQRLSLILYAWKITGEGFGRPGTNFRVQTTRSHPGELLNEPGRLTLGCGIDTERGVLALFDGWTKRNTGASSSVHIKRALLDEAAHHGNSEDGPPWDSRVAARLSSPDKLLPWIHRQRERRLAPVKPLTLEVSGEDAKVSADLWDSSPAAWIRSGDRFVLSNQEGTDVVDRSVWAVESFSVAVSNTGRYPRRTITFKARRHGRIAIDDAQPLLAGISRSSRS